MPSASRAESTQGALGNTAEVLQGSREADGKAGGEWEHLCCMWVAKQSLLRPKVLG